MWVYGKKNYFSIYKSFWVDRKSLLIIASKKTVYMLKIKFYTINIKMSFVDEYQNVSSQNVLISYEAHWSEQNCRLGKGN